MDSSAVGKLDPSTITTLIIATAALIATGLVAAAAAFIVVGRAAFHASSPAAAGSFGLLFLALPALSTIVFIVLATATLTAMGVIPANGCIAIFSSVASFVLGAEMMRTLRDFIPKPQPLASGEFSTIRLRLLKIAVRIKETASRVRLAFAANCPDAELFRSLVGALLLRPT